MRWVRWVGEERRRADSIDGGRGGLDAGGGGRRDGKSRAAKENFELLSWRAALHLGGGAVQADSSFAEVEEDGLGGGEEGGFYKSHALRTKALAALLLVLAAISKRMQA